LPFGIKIETSKRPPRGQKVQQEVKREEVPGKIDYEVVRQKDERTVIVKKGRISKKKEFLTITFQGTKRMLFPNHIIKETWVDKKGKQRTRYFVRWNAYLSESYDTEGKIVYDPSLENHLMNDMESQLGKAVGVVTGFVLERPMMYVMAVAFFVAMPIGFNFPAIFPGWAPNTVIHWISQP